VARRMVRERDLPMKVASASYNLDGSRLTIYFTSEGRVDFRDLVRDLAHELHVQVQLRQVGPRDQAKAIDGYGRCGRRLCCSSWLVSFPSISIKMAKEQNLPLNPSKISGQCGRLLCCLAYEDDTYKQLKAQLPKVGTSVSTPNGGARVLAVNALRQTVTLQMDSMDVVEMPAAALAIDRGVVRIVAEPAEPPPPPPIVEPQPVPAAPVSEPSVVDAGPAERRPRSRSRSRSRRPAAASTPPPPQAGAAPPPASAAPATARPDEPPAVPETPRPRRHRRRRRGGARPAGE